MHPTLPIAHCRGCGQPIQPHPHQVCPTCLAALAKDAVGATHTQATSAISPAQLEALEQIARTIEGFEILERVGAGGMGVVFRARQTRLGRVVAIKMLPSSDDEQMSSRFSREARAMAALSHPHIVTVHDFGITKGHPYLVMEYIEGPNLRQLLATGALHAKAALALVPDLCDALSYAHDQGVVHRDIKPENVLFTRDGRPKIADFGLAKITGPAAMTAGLTHSRMVMGTPQYMAPEQWESSRDVDHRADIYSLGVMIYEMLTHELPLGRFEVPSRHAAIDARMDEVVMRALERDPQRRYQHARDLSSAIKDLARHAVAEAIGSPAAPAGAAARSSRPTPVPTLSRADGHPVGMPRWATALFVGALLVVGALLPWFGEPATVPADGRLAVGEKTWLSSTDWSSSWGLHQLTLEVKGVEIHGLLGTIALAGGLLLWMAQSPFAVLASALGLACYGALVYTGSKVLVVRHGALGSLVVAAAWTIAIGFEYLRAWWLRSHAIEVRWGVLAGGIVLALGVVLAIPSGPGQEPALEIVHGALIVLILGLTAFTAMRRPSPQPRVLSPWKAIAWIFVGLGTMLSVTAVMFVVAARPMPQPPSRVPTQTARTVAPPSPVMPPLPRSATPDPVDYAQVVRVEELVARIHALIAAGQLEEARNLVDTLARTAPDRVEHAQLAKLIGDLDARRDDAERLFAEGRGEEAMRLLAEAGNQARRDEIARVVEIDAAMRAAHARGELELAKRCAEQLLALVPEANTAYAQRAKEVLSTADKKPR